MNTNPAILVIGGLLLGLAGGYGLSVATTDPVQIAVTETEVIKQGLSEEELASMCAEPIEEGANALQEAQARVVRLEDELASKRAELTELKRQAALDEAASEAARAEGARLWAAKEAEIEQLKGALDAAITERDSLKEELRVTIYKLDQQILETEKAREEAEYFKNESTVNLWGAFMAGAKVEICDRGTRKRHAKCHDAVEAALGKDVRDRFVECVNTYQSTPLLVQGEKDMDLPPYAEYLNRDDRFTRKGWYIQFCDPTLPEAERFNKPG